jgi:hypothetical protein
MDTLSARGRAVRVAGTALAFLVLLGGTLWGQDDHFPFGPFRMYSTAPDPDAPAPDTKIEGVDATGRTVVLTEANSGVRRAEIEGRQHEYVRDPTGLRQVAMAYAGRSPGAPRLIEVRIVIHWEGVRDSRPTGTSTDEVLARWVAP